MADFSSRKSICHDSTKVAFSLVETVIAVAIVTFALVSILGLIPVGLGTFRDAMNLTVESSIVQSVSGEILRRNYDGISATNYYFDQEGVQVSSRDTSKIYAVFVKNPQMIKTVDAINKAALVTNSTPGLPAAWTVVIQITNRTHPRITNSYFVIIPRGN